MTQQTLCKLSFWCFAGQHLSDIKGYLGDFDGCVLETQTDKWFRQLNLISRLQWNINRILKNIKNRTFFNCVQIKC